MFTTLWHSIDECKKHGIYELGPTLGDDVADIYPVLKLIPGIKQKIEGLRHHPIAVKELFHFNQLELYGQFQRYDYNMYEKDDLTNEKIYG